MASWTFGQEVAVNVQSPGADSYNLEVQHQRQLLPPAIARLQTQPQGPEAATAGGRASNPNSVWHHTGTARSRGSFGRVQSGQVGSGYYPLNDSVFSGRVGSGSSATSIFSSSICLRRQPGLFIHSCQHRLFPASAPPVHSPSSAPPLSCSFWSSICPKVSPEGCPFHINE